jgi:hypothetical protein
MKMNIHFRTYLAQFFLEIKKISDRTVEKIESHILYSVNFGFENRPFCEIMRKNIVEPEGLQMTICITRNILGYKHTHNMNYLLLFHCNSG